MKKKVYYPSYLKLDAILSSQKCLSLLESKPAHDEMLFIITHQALELWMKQLHHELDSILDVLGNSSLDHQGLAMVLHRLERITKVQDLMRAHFTVLETMTPLDFLDFRDALIPASGFQSLQFKQLEKKLGIASAQPDALKKYSKEVLDNHDQASLEKPCFSLFEGIQAWLERNPFLKFDGYDFETSFLGMVTDVFDQETSRAEDPPFKRAKDDTEESKNIKDLKSKFQKDLSETNKGLSKKAFLSALFIHYYRDQALLHLPYQILRTLVEIDQKHVRWKQRHLSLVRMMIGFKTGTGGTSGQGYLHRSIEASTIFPKLISIPSYMTSRQNLVPLPEHVSKALSFKWV